MIKQYFTDGLIQIAIILSLLRTDLNSYLNSNILSYPEVQEIILGSSAAYTQTNFHNLHNAFHSFSSHPKHIIENELVSSSIFQDLRSLSRFRRFNGLQTDVSAFLAPSLAPPTEDEPSDDNNNHLSSYIDDSNEDDAESGIGSTTSQTDGELTEEDIDLIDILWRQDIDMGCGKEVFDVNLRRELEKEQEIEIQKQQHKRDELEYSRRKLEEEKRRQEEQWLTDNFMQDGETGEWIPLSDNPPLLDQAQQDLLGSSGTEDYCLDAALNLLQGESSNPLVDIPEYASATDQQNDVENLVEEAEKYMTQTEEPQAPVPLQNTLEECWQDLVSVLNLTGSGNMMAYLNSAAAAAEASVVPETLGLIQNATLPSVTNDSSVLLQNATMPAVAEPAVATLGGYNSNMFLPQLMQFNSSMPGYGSQLQLDWEPSDLMFGNVTSPGNDSILDEVEQFLPSMLSDATEMSYLDLTNEGDFANIPGLDDSGSDSAISLSGSNSPSQEMTDMDVASLSPYDGMVGATGGSDYGSSSGSTKSLKYEPDEYDYSFGTYQFSNSENGNHSNFSSGSTNNTKFNGQSGAENVQHNHTYPLQSKTDSKFTRKLDRQKQKGPQSRDEKRVMDMKIPFTLGQIVGTPVDEFNEMMTKYKLSDMQMQLVRDIRRRGKNKVAAQNCRKRKMSVITNIEDDVESLAEKKERLLRERQEIEQETLDVKENFGQLYREIFHSLRDEQGEPYNPHEYSLQQTSDGNVFLVPRNSNVDKGDKDKANKRRKNGGGKKRL